MTTATEAAHDAERVLKRVWQWGEASLRLPVDPVRIARNLGIDVYQAHLDQNVYAALVKEPGQDPTILLNAIDSPNRQRFSCAHEIGHFMRHSDDEYEYLDRRDMLSSGGNDPEEVYANNFAACLLMPEDEVRRLSRQGATDFDLAVTFDVSREAMNYRLMNLRLRHAGRD